MERDPDSWLWRQGALAYRTGEFRQRIDVARSVEKYAGRRVALKLPTSLQIAMHLTALDGVASEILLLPPDLPEATAQDFQRRADIEAVVSSQSGDGQTPLFGPDAGTSNSHEVGRRQASGVETRWVIPTSGTTGMPKLVAHTLASLTRSLKADKRRGVDFRWGLLYDLTRFAGLQVFLQAICGGSVLIFPENPSNVGLLVAELVEQKCNALSATPSMWRKLLMAEAIAALPLKLISMGGEIADQTILSALKAKFPEARITHIYASTEAGVGFSVSDGLAGFPAAYLEGIDGGPQVRVDGSGFLHVKSVGSRQRYVGDQAAISNEDGWINTGDIVRLEGERYLFLGRENGAINVGGNKVQPHEIEQVILAVAGVAQVRVFARSNPFVGNVVHAQVVPGPNCDPQALEASIQSTCDARLADYKRPALIHIVPEIVLSTTGKVQR